MKSYMKSNTKQKVIYLISIILAISVGVVGTILVFRYVPGTTEVVNRTVQDVTIEETNTIKDSINKIKDAVVVIESYQNGQQVSQGSGFVYKKEDGRGFVLTNHHVIDGATEIRVVNNNDESVEATLLGSDELSDLAVLSIDESAVMDVATFANSEDVEVGDTVFTVGTPLGNEYKGTVTKGILSGKNRLVTVDTSTGGFVMEVLQTDAAMNPGNSGGPLCNVNGEVIGVNSLKLVEDEIEGMGFAIPSEMVQSELEALEQGQTIVRPRLGVEFTDLSNSYLLYRNGIMVDDDIDHKHSHSDKGAGQDGKYAGERVQDGVEDHAVLHDHQNAAAHSDYQTCEHHGTGTFNPGLANLISAESAHNTRDDAHGQEDGGHIAGKPVHNHSAVDDDGKAYNHSDKHEDIADAQGSGSGVI